MARLILLLGVVAAAVVVTSAAPVGEEGSGVPDTDTLQTELALETTEEVIAQDVKQAEDGDLLMVSVTDTETVLAQKVADEFFLEFLNAVEADTKTKIKQLIETADPIENDISSSPSLLTTSEVPMIDAADNAEKEIQKDVEKTLDGVDQTTPKTEVATPIVVEMQEEDLVVEEFELLDDKSNTTETVIDIIEKDKNEAVVVLGEYPEEEIIQENVNEYQLVLGESEDGTQVLSEFDSTQVVIEQSGDMSETPVIESVVYEYPPDNIQPSSVFRPNQFPDMPDYALLDGDMMIPNMDYDYHTSHADMDYHTSHDVMDYQTDPDYFPDYTDSGSAMEYPTSNSGYSPDYFISTFDDGMVENHMSNPADVIVAGVHDNYHPDPMMGSVPPNTDVDYPDYSFDDTIFPAGMVNFDTPAVELNTFEEDNSVTIPSPNMPERVEFPQPVAEFAVVQDPMASVVPMMSNDNQASEVEPTSINDISVTEESFSDYTDLMIAPETDHFMVEDPFNFPTKEIIIKLDFENEAAYVNGKPFAIKEPTNLLGFIEKMLNVAAMSARIPSNFPQYNYNNMRPQRPHFNSDMSYNPMYDDSDYFFPSSYGSPDYDYYSEPQYIDNNYYDNLPMNPFLRMIRERLVMSKLNAALRSSALETRDSYGYGPTTSRFQRSASPYYHHPMDQEPYYNPYWY